MSQMSQSRFSTSYKPGFQRKIPYAKYQSMSRNAYRYKINQRQQVRQILQNKERKYSDSTVSGHQVCQGGTWSLLHSPLLGSDYNNRVGRKTVAKSVYIRGKLEIVAAATPKNANVGCGLARMILVVDNQPNGDVPAVTDLLVSASAESQLNPNNRDRFTILKDKQFVLDAYAVDLVGAFVGESWNRTIHPIKVYRKFNIESIFNGEDDGSIGSINTGAIYMFWIGDWGYQANEEDWKVMANVSTRVRFDDS